MRITDINGDIISMPEGYEKALKACFGLVDGMEDEGVDRSDILCVMRFLISEVDFHINFLPRRLPNEL